MVHAGGRPVIVQGKDTLQGWKTRCRSYFLLSEVHLHVQTLRPPSYAQAQPNARLPRAPHHHCCSSPTKNPLAAVEQCTHTRCETNRNATRTHQQFDHLQMHGVCRAAAIAQQPQPRNRTPRHPMPASAAMASSAGSWLIRRLAAPPTPTAAAEAVLKNVFMQASHPRSLRTLLLAAANSSSQGGTLYSVNTGECAPC